MYNIFNQVKTEIVEIHLAGNSLFKGTIIDIGKEIIVLYDGKEFIYISFDHVESISIVQQDDSYIQAPSSIPSFILKEKENTLTLENVLSHAQGMYTEIYVTNKQPLHGTISKVLTDYFVFHSPIYKRMYIAIDHLKWIIPYSELQRPYDLSDEELKLKLRVSNGSDAERFEELVGNMKNKLVVFNLGEKNHHIGKVKNIHGQIIELQNARTKPTYLNVQHIKTIHEV